MYFYLALILLCMNFFVYQDFRMSLKSMILANIISIVVFFICKFICSKVEK